MLPKEALLLCMQVSCEVNQHENCIALERLACIITKTHGLELQANGHKSGDIHIVVQFFLSLHGA